MIDFYLYRTKFTLPSQRSLFGEELLRRDLFSQAIEARPSLELRKGHFWHIGNVNFIDRSGGYFAVGRTTNSILEKYDQRSGNFTEEVLETSPYTHVIFDVDIGFVAIAKKPRLSPTVGGIARNIEKLIRQAAIVRSNAVGVALDPISDPYDFINSIKTAYSIRLFEVTFSRSNPFDADEFFQKPMEKYLDAADGNKGRTAIVGESLNPTLS